MVSVLAIGPNVRVFKTLLRRFIFKVDINRQHTFLRRVNKAGVSMS
jgi:hypothetical protein